MTIENAKKAQELLSKIGAVANKIDKASKTTEIRLLSGKADGKKVIYSASKGGKEDDMCKEILDIYLNILNDEKKRLEKMLEDL